MGAGTPDTGVPELDEPPVGEDDGGEDPIDDNGESRPVATEGGEWDAVHYAVPFYVPASMPSDPAYVVKARINWLGIEQLWAIQHPGQAVVDPYSEDAPYRNLYYPAAGYPIEDFLDVAATDIQVTAIDSEGEDVAPQPVIVPVTYGWNGPRQVILL